MSEQPQKSQPVEIETDVPMSSLDGHHAMAKAAFSWDDLVEVDVPMSSLDGHHAMAKAAFSWDDVTA